MTTRTFAPRVGEQLPKDPFLLVLPSGRKVSALGVRYFDASEANIVEEDEAESMGLPPGTPLAEVHYMDGNEIVIVGAHDIAAFDAALNSIGIYVNAPTLEGDDADGDGRVGE